MSTDATMPAAGAPMVGLRVSVETLAIHIAREVVRVLHKHFLPI